LPLVQEPVLSTDVEVFPTAPTPGHHFRRALHGRGGLPVLMPGLIWVLSCSPRTWRSSGGPRYAGRAGRVLSTDVEVFRGLSAVMVSNVCALHGRGGLPGVQEPYYRGHLCSPRTWRSSVRSGTVHQPGPVLSTD